MKRGRRAPTFRLQDDMGAWVSLKELCGQRVVLFFYPKDDSTGCTVEVCEFRDELPRIASADAVVFGISPDSVRKHAKFRAKHALPYRLLSDPDHTVCEAYDVWHEKMFWGRKYMGVVRSTFVIGADGRGEQAWRDVAHEGHAAVVRAWLRGEDPPPDMPKSKKRNAAPRVPRKRRAARKK